MKVPKFRSAMDYRTSSTFGPALMPDPEKLDLARSLLAEFGVTHVQQRGYELIHSCCLPFGSHAHGDKSPSASLNFSKLTYNCLGCGTSGGLLWLIGVCRGESPDRTRQWLQKVSGLSDDPESLGNLLRLLDAIFDDSATGHREPIPRLDPSVLDPWRVIHPWVTEVRGIPRSTAERFQIGYGYLKTWLGEELIESERIVIPHFWQGDLVGWQSRRLANDGTAKYLSSPQLPKDETLYNLAGREALVVESPMSVLSKWHLAPQMEATFGAKVTDRQLRLLSRHSDVTLWMDNDEAGWKATRSVGDFLVDHCPVWVVDSPYDADPADLDDDTFSQLLESRVPYALWSAPRELVAL